MCLSVERLHEGSVGAAAAATGEAGGGGGGGGGGGRLLQTSLCDGVGVGPDSADPF